MVEDDYILLFKINPEFKNYLDDPENDPDDLEQKFREELIQGFQDSRMPLSDSFTTLMENKGIKWLIKDNENMYTARKDDRIGIYERKKPDEEDEEKPDEEDEEKMPDRLGIFNTLFTNVMLGLIISVMALNVGLNYKTTIHREPLFSIDSRFQGYLDSTPIFSTVRCREADLGQLDEGRFPDALRREFEDNKVSLSQDVAVSIEAMNHGWQIIDRGDSEQTYLIRMTGDRLNIYGDTTAGLAEFEQQFEKNGILLSSNYIVSIEKTDEQWLMTHNGRAYTIKKVVDKGTSQLKVYEGEEEWDLLDWLLFGLLIVFITKYVHEYSVFQARMPDLSSKLGSWGNALEIISRAIFLFSIYTFAIELYVVDRGNFKCTFLQYLVLAIVCTAYLGPDILQFIRYRRCPVKANFEPVKKVITTWFVLSAASASVAIIAGFSRAYANPVATKILFCAVISLNLLDWVINKRYYFSNEPLVVVST